jgi:hypothetical protein
MRAVPVFPLRRAVLPAVLAVAAAWPAPPAAASEAPSFDDWSDGATMRLDYHHSGRAGEEAFALDTVRREGPWPGNRVRLVDALNLGPYRFEVRDRATSRVLYAQGFASIFSEWETTGEAREMRRSFHESLRFPFPRAAVQVNVLRRGADDLFREAASFAVDPASKFVLREPAAEAGTVWSILDNGPPEGKVDLLILGDGYTRDELPKFRDEARRLVARLFESHPFSARKGDFNVRAIDLASIDSGVDRPSDGVYRRSPLGVSYDIFGSERYALTFDNRALRDAAAGAPYEYIEILINGETYGGGGIYNLFATTVTRSGSAEYVFVHEFGHHFAALADEYYTSEVAYDTSAPPVEPWEPNLTALLDAAGPKWRDLIAPATPVPTPWDKEAYEKAQAGFQARRRELRARKAPESEMDALFAEERAWSAPFLAGQTHAGAVGAFEGAGYRATGMYRPAADCMMFTRNVRDFCPVCARAIERVIDQVIGRP